MVKDQSISESVSNRGQLDFLQKPTSKTWKQQLLPIVRPQSWYLLIQHPIFVIWAIACLVGDLFFTDLSVSSGDCCWFYFIYDALMVF